MVPQASAQYTDNDVLLSYGATVAGELEDGDYEFTATPDYYFDPHAFYGTAGDQVTISMSAAGEVPIDAYLRVAAAADRSILALEVNDNGPGELESIEFTVPENGGYWIFAGSATQHQSGRYELSLQRTEAYSTASAPIENGQTFYGGLWATDSLFGEKHYQTFHISGVAGQNLTVDMKSNMFDTYLYLVGADDTANILASDDNGGEGQNARLSHILPFTGDYVVIASSALERIWGPYEITIGE